MRVVYGTVLTEAFAHAALVLGRSLVRWPSTEEVLFFCLDEGAARILRELGPPGSTVVAFETFAPQVLSERRGTMPISAFCWLCKPFVVDFLAKHRPQADWLCYLDSDMMAFSDPGARFVEARDRSVVVTPHAFRYAPFIGTEFNYGHTNAGFAGFRNNVTGLNILSWWLAKCLENCPAQPEADAFGDQKYFDDLRHKFWDDVSVGFPFSNCAAWNIGADQVEPRGDSVLWRGRPIVIYHFQGLRLLTDRWVDLYGDAFRLSRSVRKHIYRPYVRELRKAVNDIRSKGLSKESFETSLTTPDLVSRIVQTVVGRRNVVGWR